MHINSFELPVELAEALRTGSLQRERGSWPLKHNLDTYGNRLETELGSLHDLPSMAKKSAALSKDFQSDGMYGTNYPEFAGPGGIPDITDFSQIICFGDSGDGAPFCLDYRAGIPASVIWWDDVYWRKIAPDFRTFLNLFA
ncbi:MAG: SMI1/KNR4 family protein, partial [Desulfovibrionaceae bacterium]|nr:SMI1/KNR4 family protein [Desulfovibrionaceae bacterium]